MSAKVGIVIGTESDMPIMNEAIKVLEEYGVDFEISMFEPREVQKKLSEFSKNIHSKGISVVIAGTRGNFDFIGAIASSIVVPVVGIPMRSNTLPNNLESVFASLQQPNPAPIATVALDSGQNAGILAVQILATADEILMKKILLFKENLKNKILKADREMAEIKFEFRTN